LEETGKLGRRVIGYEHRVTTGRKGRSSKLQEIASPQPERLFSVEVPGHHAERAGPFSDPAAILEIDKPDLFIEGH
jgi:hypothetical protein